MSKKILSLVLLWVLLLAGRFQPVSAQVPVPIREPDNFYWATIGGPETVDPHWAYDTASATLIQNVYEGLVTFDHESVDIPYMKSNLAESWTIEDTVRGPATKYTFHIRPGITFPDGSALTAEDVEYSFQRGMVMDHAGGPMWMLYEPLTGRFTSRQWNLSDPVEVEALGHILDNAITRDDAAQTVTFNLAIPYAPFMQILAQSWASILDKDWAVAQGCWPGWDVTGYTGWLAWNNPTVGPLDDPAPVMMGTGPYTFEAVLWPDKYRLHRWVAYRGGWPAPGFAGYIETVNFENIEEWTTRKLMFLAGTVDTVAVPRPHLPDLITNWDWENNVSPQKYLGVPEEYEEGIRCVKDLPMLVMAAVFFGYDVNPESPYVPLLGGVPEPTMLSDIDLRKAFAYALNRTAYVRDAFLGEATVPASPAIDGLPYQNPYAPRYEKDLAQVTAHLKAAWGGRIWDEGFDLVITYNIGNEMRRIAAEMLEYTMEFEVDWTDGGTRTAPHVDVTVRGVPWATYIPDLYSFNLGAFVIGWLADYPDPHNWFSPFMHPYGDFTYFQRVQYGQYNPAWTNEYVSGLIEQGVRETDPAVREAIYYELQDIYYYEVPNFPIYQPLGRHWERDWVQQWYYNTIGPWSTGPSAYYYHIWKGLDADANGDAGVDIFDAGEISVHWSGPPAGPLGYARNADINPVSELNGDAYITRGADGAINIKDAALINAHWHETVAPY